MEKFDTATCVLINGGMGELEHAIKFGHIEDSEKGIPMKGERKEPKGRKNLCIVGFKCI